MSEVRMRANADKLERVLRRQTPTEDAKHLRRIADQAIPRRVAPQQSPPPLHLASISILHSTFGHRSDPEKTSPTPARKPLKSRKSLFW